MGSRGKNGEQDGLTGSGEGQRFSLWRGELQNGSYVCGGAGRPSVAPVVGEAGALAEGLNLGGCWKVAKWDRQSIRIVVVGRIFDDGGEGGNCTGEYAQGGEDGWDG